ncbi:hypothetical protein [Bacillus fungorum]|uniref:hypothetical protein n=1 Tax=Bacillus fungorum TaxID=2039284 RepID=UPI003F567853
MNSYFPKQKKNCRRLFPAFPVALPPIVRDRFLYVSSALNNTVEIYNISNPMDPIRIREFNEGNLNGPVVLAITGTTLYVANAFGNNVTIYDISNPIIPIHAGEFNGANLNFPNGLAIFTLSS